MAVAVQARNPSICDPRERAELVLAQLDQLPTLSPVVARLLALTGDDDACIRDLVRVIESDASLTACILRLVRRADLGVRGDGMTVARAVPLLGFRLVRSAALSCPFFEALSPSRRDEATAARRRDLWRHSLAVACTAELLAEQRGGTGTPAAAFVAGLLHDVGKIALDGCFPKSYGRAWERASRERLSMCEAETDVLGIDHTVAGKRLALRWKLDAPVVEAIWLHHQHPDSIPSNVADANGVRLIQLADALARRTGMGASGSRHPCNVEELAVRLDIAEAILESVATAVPKRVDELCESLGLKEAASGDEWIESLQAAHRDLARTNAQLADNNHNLARRCAVLDAVAELNRRLTENDRVADVCAAAARAVRRLLAADAAIVLARPPASSYAHVGSDTDGGEPRATLLEAPEAAESGSAPAHGLRNATAEQASLWQRCVEVPPTPLFASSFHGDSFSGVVMVRIDEAALRRSHPTNEDWEALLLAISQVVASAWSRNEAAKTTEELLALNRKLHAAQNELAHRRSIAMIAEMAAGAAHELNNPLAVISGRAQMELSAQTDASRLRSLEIIVEQAQRASDIVAELMRFAKPEEPKPVLVPLASTLQGVCQHWGDLVGIERSTVRTQIGAGATTAYVDEDHLREILKIVLTNALEATDPARRQIKVNSTRGSSDENVRIRIEDNGVGMTPEVLEHAFDPFYSSRPAGRGRGLGLSRAYRLAEINGGRLWIESTPNVATTVSIELPARVPKR